MNVLVVKLSALGDILCTTPVFKSLKEKATRVDHLVTDCYEEISKQNPYVDNTYTIKKNEYSLKFFFSLIKTLLLIKKNKYDICFIFHRSILLNIFIKLCGIKDIYGFNLKYNFLLTRNIKYNIKKNRTYQEYDILNLIFDNIPYPYTLEFYIHEAKIKIIKPKKKYIVLSIGGGNIHSDAKNRTWPLENYLSVIKSLPNYEIYILGNGKYDEDIIKGVDMPQNAKNFINKTNLNETAQLIKDCSFFIGHDTGLIHLAAALNVKIIGLYGPTNPILAQPLASDITIIRSEHFCSPCYNPLDGKSGKMYTCKNNLCMKKIEPNQVLRTIKMYE